MKNSLYSSEWFFVGCFLILFLAFFFTAKMHVSPFSAPPPFQEENRKEFLVVIDGAVKKPGSYSVPEGTTVREILKKAAPFKGSDLRGVSQDRVIQKDLHLHIEEQKEIHVRVSGAIKEPVDLILPPNSRICDLRDKVIFTNETQKSFFQRRKRLKDGEEITVPNKTVE